MDEKPKNKETKQCAQGHTQEVAELGFESNMSWSREYAFNQDTRLLNFVREDQYNVYFWLCVI